MVIYAISSIERIKVVQNWEIKSLAPFKAVFVLFNNPVSLQQCQIDLYNCNNNPDKTVIECLVDYKDCMAQLIPPYVVNIF